MILACALVSFFLLFTTFLFHYSSPGFQNHYVTADEGDWNGGTRGFTIWAADRRGGDIVFSSGSEMDRHAQRLGHYPDHRSTAKGNEPENVEFGVFDGDDELLFVNSERTSLIFVYDVKNKSLPVLRQVLPAGCVRTQVEWLVSRVRRFLLTRLLALLCIQSCTGRYVDFAFVGPSFFSLSNIISHLLLSY
jgi:hypothetical protein